MQAAKTLFPANVRLVVPELTGICKDILLNKVDQGQTDVSSAVDLYRIVKASGLQDLADKTWGLLF